LTLSPEKVPELIRERLKPPRAPDPALIRRWIAELDDAKFAVRDAAQRNLAAEGPAIRNTLVAALKTAPSQEARSRLKRLLDDLGDRLPPERLRMLRALEVLEVLERIGTADARAQFEAVAKSTDEDIRREVDAIRRRWK
jgi:hypothetical protein